MFKYLMIVAVLGCSSTHASVELPSNITMCPKTLDPKSFNQCAKNVIDALKPYLAEGIPSALIPPMDTLSVPYVKFTGLSINLLNFNVVLKGIKVTDLMKFNINNIRVNPANLNFYMSVNIPHVVIQCSYDLQGRYIILPVSGPGTLRTEGYNVTLIIRGQGKTVKDAFGIERVSIGTFEATVDVGTYERAAISVPPSYDYAIVRSTVNYILETKKRMVLNLLKTNIDKAASVVLGGIAKKAFTIFTKEELIPSA